MTTVISKEKYDKLKYQYQNEIENFSNEITISIHNSTQETSDFVEKLLKKYREKLNGLSRN